MSSRRRFPPRLDASVAARRLRGGCAAFTLLEVLVVIAVIAVLIALLMPGLSIARRESRRVACLSNLHQIAQGWQHYLDAHGGAFLQKVNANYNYGGRQGIGSNLFGADVQNPVPKPLNLHLGLPPITRIGAEIFRCPADRGTATERPTVADYYGTSYVTNVRLIGPNRMDVNPFDACAKLTVEINKRLANLKASNISNPTKLLLMGDYGWVHTINPASTKRVEWHGVRCRHNIVFMDAHAETVQIRRGIHVDGAYTVIPFRDLQDDAEQCQQEVPCG